VIRSFIRKYYDVLAYLFFGGLTTVVSFGVYWLCLHMLGMEGYQSNAVSWVAAVAFAFLTNKPFVFKSNDWSAKVVWPELTKFVGCRVGSGVLETAIIFLTVDILSWHGDWMKVFTSVLVVVLNYFGSKFLVFKKK